MTPVPTLSFTTALITGEAGGLGKAMAVDLIGRGKSVILAGRTESESTLKATAREIGATTAYYVLDTGDVGSIAGFISRIRVVEIAPPAPSVETDLHRDRVDPDDNKRPKGSKTALTVDEFMEQVGTGGWEEDRELIAPGWAGKAVGVWKDGLGKMYREATTPEK